MPFEFLIYHHKKGTAFCTLFFVHGKPMKWPIGPFNKGSHVYFVFAFPLFDSKSSLKPIGVAANNAFAVF